MAEDQERREEEAEERQPDGRFACPDCPRSFDAGWKLNLHRINAHGLKPAGKAERKATASRTKGATRASSPAPRQPVSEHHLGKVLDATIANLIVVGGLTSIVLPHTGLAIAGVPHPDDPARRARDVQAWIVESRAVMAAAPLEAWARRDERVLRAMESFNALFEVQAVPTIIASIGAAIAVDVGMVDPHMAIEVGPFQGERAIHPVEAVIGDVIGEVDRLRALAELEAQERGEVPTEEQQPAPAASNGRARRRGKRAQDGAEVIQGGVEAT